MQEELRSLAKKYGSEKVIAAISRMLGGGVEEKKEEKQDPTKAVLLAIDRMLARDGMWAGRICDFINESGIGVSSMAVTGVFQRLERDDKINVVYKSSHGAPYWVLFRKNLHVTPVMVWGVVDKAYNLLRMAEARHYGIKKNGKKNGNGKDKSE